MYALSSMRVRGGILVCVLAGSLVAGADASAKAPETPGDSRNVPDCVLPLPKRALHAASLRETLVVEVEPNDSGAGAQTLPIDALAPDLSVTGSISVSGDVDFFRVSLVEGDTLGAALLGDGLDPVLALTNASGTTTLVVNDDGADAYPAASPFPRKVAQTDSMLTFTAPADGEYLLRASGFGASSGAYTLVLRLRRSPLESGPNGAHQTIFLDFDGETINAQAIFGRGVAVAPLSPLNAYLADWGLAPGDESALIDAIIAHVREDFDAIIAINPTYTYTLLNSRDHPDPFGQADVSRVIIGGSVTEIGFATIGSAESIDPGNFATNETAVVLLDSLSSTNPSNINSVNNVPLAPGFSKMQAVARRVANSVSHEVGHVLGCWHTDALNDTFCIMERGAINLLENRFQTGPDGVMGNDDDNPLEFLADAYYAPENVGVAPSVQNVDVRIAFALSGAFCPADFDRTGIVDGADLTSVLSNWGSADAITDLVEDGVIDGRDIAAVLASWGVCPK